MKKINILICVLSCIIITSCEITNLDLVENPNALTPNLLDVELVLNEVQVRFGDVMQDFSINTDDIMRYEGMTDTYTDVAEADALDGEYSSAYIVRENALLIKEVAEGNDGLLFHRGIARVLEAYTMATVIDYLGDVPFSEANDAANTFNPSADDDATIYQSLLTEIDLAITDFNNATIAPTTDLYFEGDAAKWIRMANSLKLRLLVNIGDTAGINAVLAENNLIDEETDDFQFQYSTAEAPVDSQHTYFNRAYEADGFSQYIGNYFMSLLKDSKPISDPRLRYYVYRQTNTNPSTTLVRCQGNPIFDFCYIGDFYWGRDHGDDVPSGNDRLLKTAYGIYPGGGSFDENNPMGAFASLTDNNVINLNGAGIFPIILSSYVEFLKAESVLSLGANGDALASLEAGIRASMNKVLNFDSRTTTSSFAATQADVDAYVASVLEEYGLASSNAEQLDIVIREYYLAAYGNSIEAYNTYRRTGFPSNIQIPVINETVPFPRTFSFPQDEVNRNTSIDQRPVTNQVFWDTNPAGFIN